MVNRLAGSAVVDPDGDEITPYPRVLTEMSSWLNLASVAAGGALGSVTRYLITLGAACLPGGSPMIGTTLANVLGCAAIGALAEYLALAEHVSAPVQLGLRAGFLGGLTTFSTFALESAVLADTGRWQAASIYVLANLVIGWAALGLAAMLVKGWMT